MRQVRTHTFNGRRYRIDTDAVDGWCDQYANNERFIHLMAPLNTRQGLITVVHESLHASNWAATEAVVDRVSREVGDLLWRLGYRRRS